jgi:DNA primase
MIVHFVQKIYCATKIQKIVKSTILQIDLIIFVDKSLYLRALNVNNQNPKYLYMIPVAMSQLLYGYSENYQYLYGNNVILVESEKSVMQAWDFGVRNIVALGSHSLSEKQTKLLLQLQPKKIIIAMDEGLGFEHTKRNADMIKNFGGILTPEIWYWDSDQDLDVDPKSSPTDMGKEKFDEIMEEQLVKIY